MDMPLFNKPACPPGEETPYTLLIRQDFDLWYSRYLRSPEWKELRSRILALAKWRCHECGAYATEVHHLTYVNVGNESEEDLQALCRRCHQHVHHDAHDARL